MFGLLNANARLYSPYLGRFISPDPLLNSDGGALDYNPYIYARNNPYKYIDRNGEIGVLAVLGIGFLIGGTVNVVCNWNNIHSWSEGFMFFGIGGVAGFAGAAVAVMAPAGFFAGALYGAIGGGLSGSILGGGNALLLGLDVGSAMFAGAWQGAVTGFVLGGFTGGANAKAKGLKYWSGNEKIPSVSANPAANVSATPQEMLSVPSDQPQPTYPEVVDYTEVKQYWIEGTKSESFFLPEGTVVDRFSTSIEGLKKGTFFGEPGTPYVNRGMLNNPSNGLVYDRWVLKKPWIVERSLVAPIPQYNIPGGGVQFRFYGPEHGVFLNAQQMCEKGIFMKVNIPF